MKITFKRHWFIFLILIFIFSSCTSFRERIKKFPDAIITYTDCSKYKKKLDERNVKSMITYLWWGKGASKVPRSITSTNRIWVYKDNRNDNISHELYRLRVGKPFGFAILNATCILYKFYNGEKPYYKAKFGYETGGGFSWQEHGTIAVDVDLRNKIIVMKYYLWDLKLFGYFEEGFFYKK